jgi:hypothetical protein
MSWLTTFESQLFQYATIRTCAELKETVNLAGLSVDVDIEVSWCSGQTRDCLDIGCKSVSVRVSVYIRNKDAKKQLGDPYK